MVKQYISFIRTWAKNNKKSAAALSICLIFILFRFIMLLLGPEAAQHKQGRPQHVYVELGEARFGTMRQMGIYYGSLTAAHRFTVATRVGGELKSLLVDIGDKIKSGDLVAKIDDEEATLALDRALHNLALADAQHAEAEANLQLAENDMERQSNLSEKKIVSRSDFEATENKLKQAQARLLVAESQLKSAQNQLDDARLRLSYTEITAVWPEGDSRYIGERLTDVGALLTPNTPIMTVVALDPLLVVVEVMERDYPKIQVGQKAELRAEAWPDEIFYGRVLRVAPVLSSASRQARVEIEVANPDLKLKPGMFTEVFFIFKELKNVWSLPQDVPFRQKNGFVIFVADPKTKTVKMMPVTLGLVEGEQVELINSPAIEGPVVFLGQHLLQDGMAYRLPGDMSRNKAESGGQPQTGNSK